MVQPHPPAQSSNAQNTDTLGIISLILSLIGFSLPGFIVGLVGVNKAKKEHHSPVLSHIGWALGLVGMIISVVLVMIFIVFSARNLYGAVESQKQTNQSSQPASYVRTVTTDGFSIEVPKDFIDLPAEYASADAQYTQGSSATSEYVMVIKERRSDFDAGMTTAGYANMIFDYYGKSITDFTVEPLPAGTIPNPAGLDAVDYRITGMVDKIRIVYCSRFIRTETSLYQVTTWTVPSKETTAKPALFAMIRSFHET